MVRLNPSVEHVGMEDYAPFRAAVGNPDFINTAVAELYKPPPDHIFEALQKAAADNRNLRYGTREGEMELREAIAVKLRKRNELEADPSTEIRVTNGAGHAFFLALLASLGPGDEVIIANPSFPLNWYTSQIVGAVPVAYPIEAGETMVDWASRVTSMITDRTRAIILHTINNPTGHVLDRAAAETLATAAQRHDLLVVSDEVYEWFVYDDRQHISVASLSGMKERTFSIYSVSKEYNLPGLRTGYVVSDARLNAALGRIQQNSSVGVGRINQAGALAALTGPQDHLPALVAEMSETRRQVVDILQNARRLSCPLPEGGFFVFPDASAIGVSDEEASRRLITEALVGVSPGSWFGDRGEGHLRLCYGAVPPHRALESARRVVKWLEESFPS